MGYPMANISLNLADNELQGSENGQRVVVFMNQGNLEEAVKLCEQAINANPRDPAPWVIGASLLLRQNRGQDAANLLNQARAAVLNNFSIHMSLGKILVEMRAFPEATQVLRKAIELAPQSADAHYFLGLAFYFPQNGNPIDHENATLCFRAATQLDPNRADVQYFLGLSCINSSKDKEAEVALRKATEMAPQWADAHYFLAYPLLEQDRVDDAMASLKRVLEIVPNHPGATEWLAKLAPAKTRSSRTRLARYPHAASEFADVRSILRDYILTEFPNPEPLFKPSTKVFTLGSCFAQNIANGLNRYGIEARHFGQLEDINSTYANRYLMEWLEGKDNAQTEPFQKFFGSDKRKETLEFLAASDLAVLSLGVAPCFFHKESGEFAPTLGDNMHISLRMKNFVFRTTSVSENLDNLIAIVDSLRRLRPGIKLVLTVSPVPLKATFERPSAILADCVSKSTLRVTAHELMQKNLEGVMYWPSYEVVRWLGGHMGQVFGNDDGSPFHVSQQLVNTIIETFIRTFGTREVVARLDEKSAVFAMTAPAPQPAAVAT